MESFWFLCWCVEYVRLARLWYYWKPKQNTVCQPYSKLIYHHRLRDSCPSIEIATVRLTEFHTIPGRYDLNCLLVLVFILVALSVESFVWNCSRRTWFSNLNQCYIFKSTNGNSFDGSRTHYAENWRRTREEWTEILYNQKGRPGPVWVGENWPAVYAQLEITG